MIYLKCFNADFHEIFITFKLTAQSERIEIKKAVKFYFYRHFYFLLHILLHLLLAYNNFYAVKVFFIFDEFPS